MNPGAGWPRRFHLFHRPRAQPRPATPPAVARTATVTIRLDTGPIADDLEQLAHELLATARRLRANEDER